MSDELDFLSRRVAQGKLSRRDFLGRAAALGIAAPSQIRFSPPRPARKAPSRAAS